MQIPHFIAFAITGAAIVYYHQQRTARRHAVALVELSRDIADFSYIGSSTIDQRLSVRAIPNARLIRTFGISNSFTTTDRLVHKAFLSKTAQLLHGITSSQWHDPYGVADAYALRQTHRSVISLSTLVRCLCFRVILRAFFRLNLPDSMDNHVSIATSEINLQWIKSKASSNCTLLTESDALNEALRCLLRYGAEAPEEAPEAPPTPQEALAIILPAYETLWRVVLLTFVSACHRGGRAFELDNLGVPACLGTDTEAERRARQIGKEGLRLYPSSKRVYRQSSSHDAELSADIEQCHRDNSIWGPDALEFKPSRFDSLTELQKYAYFPFGLPPHICPAHKGFGERIVTLAVVVLGKHYGDGFGRIIYGDEDLDGNLNTPLPTGRDSMERWSFVHKYPLVR